MSRYSVDYPYLTQTMHSISTSSDHHTCQSKTYCWSYSAAYPWYGECNQALYTSWKIYWSFYRTHTSNCIKCRTVQLHSDPDFANHQLRSLQVMFIFRKPNTNLLSENQDKIRGSTASMRTRDKSWCFTYPKPWERFELARAVGISLTNQMPMTTLFERKDFSKRTGKSLQIQGTIQILSLMPMWLQLPDILFKHLPTECDDS